MVYANTMNNKKEAPKKQNRVSQQLVHPDDELWRQVKVAAIMEGKTMTEWVEETLRERLARTKKSDTKGDV